MNSRILNYLDYDAFSRLLFGLVKEQLNNDSSDPLPDYRKENSENLEKILGFVRSDLYPTLVDKSAYLFVAVVKGHIYSNGNKRLGFVTLMYFLFINGFALDFKPGEAKELALYVADSFRNHQASFDELKQYVGKLLEDKITSLEDLR